MLFTNIHYHDLSAPTFFFDAPDGDGGEKVEETVSNIRVEGDKVEPCGICNEPFEKFWDEEEEEWMIKNAIRVDGKARLQR
jgi:cytidine deaminase